jgi:uncharacterized membrane protein
MLPKFLLILGGLVILLGGGWIASHAVYHSWHPCDWLLQETVQAVLQRRGIDSDTASIPLQARVVELTEVQAVLRLRNTPAQCASTWLLGLVFP